MKNSLNRFLPVCTAAVLLIGLLFIYTACTTSQTPPITSASQLNRPPVISQIIGASNYSPSVEGQFKCIASDPDGDNLTYVWTADNGTIKGEGNTATWMSPPTMGNYKITVAVSDGKGNEVRGVEDVKVFINADGSITLDPPVVLNMSMSQKDVVTGAKRMRIWTPAPVECVVDGSDNNDLKFVWTASNGRLQGKGINEGTASKVTWIAPGAGGDYTLDVTVTDGSGNEARGTVNFHVYCCGNY